MIIVHFQLRMILGSGLLLFAASGLAGELVASGDPAPTRPLREPSAAVESGPQRVPRVIGGRLVREGEFPWMAGILDSQQTTSPRALLGGGVLIHPSWVLTAAHVMIQYSPADIDVHLGSRKLHPAAPAQRIRVVEIIRHPGFHAFSFDHDLALLRLETPALPPAAALPVVDDPALVSPGTMARLAGWGGVREGEYSPDDSLREATVPIVDRGVANATDAYQGRLTASMLAAGFAEGGVDACLGDSGGPLLVDSPVAPGVALAGIVSFGKGCARPNAYGIYADVFHQREFILSHLYPGYLDWESTAPVRGELRDPDQDGVVQLLDFGMAGGNPNAVEGEFPGLRIVRPRGGGGLHFPLQENPALASAWHPVPEAETLTSSMPLAGGVLETYQSRRRVKLASLPERRDFLRFGIHPSPRAAPLRMLAAPGWAEGVLVDGDPPHPSRPGVISRVYRVAPLAIDTAFRVTLRSPDFQSRLEIIDAANGELIADAGATASGKGRTGGDVEVVVAGSAARNLELRVSTQGVGDRGRYEIAVREVDPPAVPAVISIPGDARGAFGPSSPLNPAFLPERPFRMIERRLDVSSLLPGTPVTVSFHVENGAGLLEIYNSETGMLLAWPTTDEIEGTARCVLVPEFGGSGVLIRGTADQRGAVGGFQLTAIAGAANVHAVPGSDSFELLNGGPQDPLMEGANIRDVLLTEVPEGAQVDLRMESPEVDAYLVLLDADTHEVLGRDDNGGGGTNSRLIFKARAGTNYLVRASSYFSGQTGAFTIRTSILTP